jgi:hypothetical protein
LVKKIMGNGWTATAGEDFIAIASNLSVDPTQQRRNRSVSHSAIERKIWLLVTLTVDLYRASPGSLLRTRTPRPTLIPLASNCAISEKNLR